MPKPFIAVRRGRQPGIYAGWEHAQPQVHGYSGQQFKGFDTYEEAHRYLYGEPWLGSQAFAEVRHVGGQVVRVALDAGAVESLLS